MVLHYKLEGFEGPLDLLLHLIDKSEVDIYEISIHEITDQYMEYLREMQRLELEITSEFLVMASTLLYMKSKMLLPKPPVEKTDEEEEDGEHLREQLIQKLIEYRKYKEIAELLKEKEADRSLIYTREPSDLTAFLEGMKEEPVIGVHIADLILAFQKVLLRAQKRGLVARVRRDEITVMERMEQVTALVAQSGGSLAFSRLFPPDATREEIVVTFLAVLELMKMKKIVCHQHHLFEEILIQLRGEEGGFVGLLPIEIRH